MKREAAPSKVNPLLIVNFDRDLVRRDLINVIKNESQTLTNLIKNFPQEVIILVEKILQTTGRVVFSGMGKSGIIAKKIVATFSSMGTPALFLHPSEALHGDLGMVQANDLFVALSKSGTGRELEQVFNVLHASDNQTVLICCNRGKLASMVDLVVQLPFEREACMMNLAPTSSSTLMLAIGDALAVSVSKLIGFEKQDFARAHPAGALGKRLLLTVESLMFKNEELPFISMDTAFKDLLVTITSKKLGVGIVVSNNKRLLGVITDGDLRRACSLGSDVFEKNACDIMTLNPKSISVNLQAYKALEIMEKHNITILIVTEKDRVIGLIHIHDLIKAGIR